MLSNDASKRFRNRNPFKYKMQIKSVKLPVIKICRIISFVNIGSSLFLGGSFMYYGIVGSPANASPPKVSIIILTQSI